MEIYVDKLIKLIDGALINTINVIIMEVPCCGGLIQMVQKAVSESQRKVPVKATVVGIRGEIISENWV